MLKLGLHQNIIKLLFRVKAIILYENRSLPLRCIL